MPWLYKIAAHSLFYRKGTDSDGDQLVTTEAYSGFPPDGKNNPAMCNVQNIGPLPTGGYMIRDFHDNAMLGVLAAYLDPSAGNQMFGRGGFYIHGDSALHPGAASHGCIILPHDVRESISRSTDRSLLVTA